MIRLIALLARRKKYRKALEKYRESNLFEERKRRRWNSLNTIGVVSTKSAS